MHMRRKALVWKLFPIYFLITLASVVVVSLYALEAQREFYYSQVESDLETRARLIERSIAANRLSASTMEPEVKSLGRCCGTRITVILPSGKVIADSERDPAGMENHRTRPEIREALAGKVGTSRRLSPTLGMTMIYVAVPLQEHGKVVGVVRTSLAANRIDARPAALYDHVLLGTLLIAALAGIVSLIAARRISRPIRAIKDAAAKLAAGDLDTRVRPPDSEELGSLADTLNAMAARIGSQLRTITQQAGEQRAILASMSECVIALDGDDRLMLLNPAAEQLLGVALDQVKGKTIQEAVRNPALQRFVGECYADGQAVETEIVFHGARDRILQAVGAELLDSEGNRIGALVVLNDVTAMRKLENVRRDFVANVSHELKTPITSIRGFVETLRQGIDDPRKTDEFLEIVEKQAGRLQSIIEDLLVLSEIEQTQIPMQPTSISGVLQSAIALCQAKAEDNDVEVTLTCEDCTEIPGNSRLIEQAITNLLDNAIKYSRGGRVSVSAERAEGELVIRVADTGCGIEEEHLPRLFERFYRADKARSRNLGGTGLGLAIVKHIVQAHGGRVGVESTPGKGSTFSVFLPDGSRKSEIRG
jgi:two-component system phosphate regulon sensor histidine kinase PhoR